MTQPLTERSARIVAARKLTRRAGRDAAGLFLAEGRQAVVEALADPARVREVLVTEAAAAAHRDLLSGTDVPVRVITDKAAAGLSETVTPQGLLAVCELRDVDVATLTARPPRLAVALAELARGHVRLARPVPAGDDARVGALGLRRAARARPPRAAVAAAAAVAVAVCRVQLCVAPSLRSAQSHFDMSW